MKQRCVFDKAEVVVSKQPQQTTPITNEVKKVEAKEIVSNSPKTKKKKEKINKVEPKEEVPEEQKKTCRKGYHLYTICSTIKIGNDRTTVQRIVEEKSEKLANVEYNRIFKKEYGKPKSVTRRTIKPYSEEDEEFSVEFIEEKPVEREKTPEEIEFENKLKVLDGGHIGLFKVTLNKNPKMCSTQYIFAKDYDDVKYQMSCIAKEDKVVDEDEMLNSIKNITKMTSFSIRTDKNCLKRLNTCSYGQIKQLEDNAIQAEAKMFKTALKKYNTMKENGYELYVCKVPIKPTAIVCEFAKNTDDAMLLLNTEERIMKETMLNNQKFDGVGISTMEEIIEKSIAHAKAHSEEDVKEENFIDNIAKVVKDNSHKTDRVYQLLFDSPDDTFLETYEKHVQQTKDIYNKIKEGKGNEMLQEELDKLNKKISGDVKALEGLLKVDKTRANMFNGDMSKLRALLNK